MACDLRVDQVLPEVGCAKSSRGLSSEHAGEALVVDDCALRVADRCKQNRLEIALTPGFLFLVARPPLLDERVDRGHDGLRDGEIHARALLHVQKPDLERHSVEASDAAAGVYPLMLKNAFGIEGTEVSIDPVEQSLVLGSREHGLGNHPARDRRDATRVASIHFEPRIQKTTGSPVDIGRARRESR